MENSENYNIEDEIHNNESQDSKNEFKSSFSFFKDKSILKNFVIASITLPLLFFLYLKFEVSFEKYQNHQRSKKNEVFSMLL